MSLGNRKKWWLIAETILAIGIVIGVVLYFRNVLQQMPPVDFTIRVEYLIAAAVLYLLAHFCWATFWVRLLHSQGVNVPWWIGLRTYYISQFGKYIPGKFAVLVMRVGMLRHHGGHPIPVAVTATYETLTSMAAGALLAVAFIGALGVLPPEMNNRRMALFAVAALPIGLGLLNKAAVLIAKKKRGPNAAQLPAPPILLLAQGLFHGAAGYCVLALSLASTVCGILPVAPEVSAEGYAICLAAVAFSYVAGFVFVIAPGGLGARELVLVAALTPPFVLLLGEPNAAGLAIVVALTLRLTWTVAEIVLGLLLYVKKPAIPPILHPTLPLPHKAAHEKPHA